MKKIISLFLQLSETLRYRILSDQKGFKLFITSFFISILCFTSQELTYASALSIDAELDSSQINTQETSHYDKSQSFWDPFSEIIGDIPTDLNVSSDTPNISIIQYSSGIIAIDAHKIADQLPQYTISYKFTANKDGILYIKHGDTLFRYGQVKKNDPVLHTSIHETKYASVENEFFQVYYADPSEEQMSIAAQQNSKLTNHPDELNEKERPPRLISLFIIFSAIMLLLICVIRSIKYKDPSKTKKRFLGSRSYIPMYITAFLIPFSILMVSCMLSGVTPFGKNTIFVGDGIVEGIPNMFQARDQILQGNLLYSFSSGGGTNLYYLNPVMFLSAWLVLFPSSILAEVICFSVMIKIALSGTSMYLYLKKSERFRSYYDAKSDPILLAFSTAYSLSSYQLCFTCFFNWSDLVALLPIIALMMERMMTRQKKAGYILVLALSIVLNCYNAIYVCFFLIIWFFTFSFENFRDFFKKGISFALCSLLSVGVSFWVVFSTILSRIYGVYAYDDTGIPKPFFFQSFWKTIGQSFILSHPISGTSENGMVNLYSGIFVALLIIYRLLTLQKNRQHLYKIVICIFILISTNLSSLDYIWNGFHYQHMVPGRYTFLLTFVSMHIGYDVYCEIKKKGLSKTAVKMTALIAFVIIILTTLFSDESLISSGLTTVLFIIYVIYSLSLAKKCTPDSNLSSYRYLFLSLVVIEITINTVSIFSDYSDRIDFYSYRHAAQWLKEYDPAVTEMDRTAFLGGAVANQGECGDLGSMDVFSSFLTFPQYLYGSSLGMASTNNMIRDSFNLTPMSNALGRIKYIFVPHYIEAFGLDLDEYKVIGEVDGIIILKNDKLVPEGFLIDYDVIPRLDEAPGREQFLNALSEYYTNGQKVFDIAIPIEKAENRSEFVKHDNAYISDGFLFENFSETTLRTKVEKAGNYYYSGNCYSNLGKYMDNESKETNRILLQPEEAILVRFDKEAFESFIKNINEAGFHPTLITDGKLKGKIVASHDGYLCFPIPYEPGWKIKINGINGSLQQIRNGMMAADLKKGENDIELNFTPVGMPAGIITSVISLIITLLILLAELRKKPISASSPQDK